MPFGFSSSGEFSGDLVFAGYGIEAESLGYTELSGLDLRGKVAVPTELRDIPGEQGAPAG